MRRPCGICFKSRQGDARFSRFVLLSLSLPPPLSRSLPPSLAPFGVQWAAAQYCKFRRPSQSFAQILVSVRPGGGVSRLCRCACVRIEHVALFCMLVTAGDRRPVERGRESGAHLEFQATSGVPPFLLVLVMFRTMSRPIIRWVLIRTAARCYWERKRLQIVPKSTADSPGSALPARTPSRASSGEVPVCLVRSRSQ